MTWLIYVYSLKDYFYTNTFVSVQSHCSLVSLKVFWFAFSSQVLEWDIKPVEGEGYLSEMLSLDVRYSIGGEDKKVNLVAKLLPPDPSNRAFVRQTQFDLREIKFYTEVKL